MKKFLLALPLLLLAFHFGKMLVDAGVFLTLEPKGFENCTLRAEVSGPEDLEYSRTLHKVFISSDNRPQKGEKETPSGAIYAFSPGDQEQAVKVSPDLPFPFHPHGIALWEEPGLTRLFALSHGPEESSVEVFDWEGSALRHVKTITDSLLITPNDLLPLGPEEFFVSHDHGSRSHLLHAVEHFTRIGRGYLTLYREGKFQTLDTGISFANGLAYDPERKTLYLAAMLEKAVRVYDVSNPESPKLRRKISLPAAPDNLHLDAKGNLWIGAHPKMLTLKTHSETHASPAPSQILKVRNPESESPETQILFTDTGEKIPAASVALPVGEKLFIGAIYAPKVLECGARPSY